MNIEYGKSMQLGSKYVHDLLDSNMTVVFNGTGFRWRGMFKTTETYAMNDVVLHVGTSEIPELMRATQASSGTFDPGKWEKFDFEFANKNRLDYANNLLSTLIFALTGSSAYKGSYDTNATYEKNDVVTVVLNGSTLLVRANDTPTKGSFSLDEWSILRLMTEKEIRGLGSGNSVVTPTYEIHIPKTGWVNDTSYFGYTKRYDLYIRYIKKEFVPQITYHFDSMEIVDLMCMCPVINVSDGKLQFYARENPTGEINATMTLVNVMNGIGSIVSPTYDITIPTTGWVNDETVPECSKRFDLQMPNIEASHVPCVIYQIGSLGTIEVAEFSHVVKSKNGILQFFSKYEPASDVHATVVMTNMIGSTETTIVPTYTINIPKDGWIDDTSITGFTKRFDLYNENVRAGHIVNVVYNTDALDTLWKMWMCANVKVEDGVVRFYAKELPKTNIGATLVVVNTLQGVVATTSSIDYSSYISQLSDLIATDEETSSIIRDSLGI